MSASQWDWSAASASGLLTNEECSMLLDANFFDADDLLKTFPNAAAKEPSKYQVIDDVSSLYPPSPPETKPSRAELAQDLLQQLDNQCKQENIFPNWLEEKVELPIFENIPVVERVDLSAGLPAYSHPQPTEELLREFESVYGAVELTHLTPPQSPPGPATQLLLSYAQAQCVLPPALQWPAAQLSPVAPLCPAAPLCPTAPLCPASPPLYDASLQAVEELVRHRAAHLPSPLASEASSSPPCSPHSSPHSSPRSSTDDEWASPRAKPYSRSVDDRRSRKKEQNKNAATRYRQKKKAEVEVLLGEEQNLRQRHTELGEKCSDIQREIKYLKGLMRDLFKAKGLIK